MDALIYDYNCSVHLDIGTMPMDLVLSRVPDPLAI